MTPNERLTEQLNTFSETWNQIVLTLAELSEVEAAEALEAQDFFETLTSMWLREARTFRTGAQP